MSSEWARVLRLSFVAGLLVTAGAGCGVNPMGSDCDPASFGWQIDVDNSPMIKVDNTPSIRVGERLPIGVLTFGGIFCGGASVSSVSWVLSNPTVATLTPDQPSANQASILGVVPGETAITALITFAGGTTARTSSLFVLSGTSRNVLRILP